MPAVKWVIIGAAVIGAATAILFALFPQWDLAIAGYFYSHGGFPVALQPWARAVRKIGKYLPWLFAGPAFAALALKLVFPQGRMLMPARAAVLIAATLALGPGLMVNGILKEYWGRPRPIHMQAFGGDHAFTPWYSPHGTCPTNCSFVSGEGATGAFLVAPASLVPGPMGVVAMTAAVGFALLGGGLRIAFGGHFFTDVVLSMVLVIFLIAGLRYLLYNRPRAPSDAMVEAAIGAMGLAARRGFSAAWSRIAGSRG